MNQQVERLGEWIRDSENIVFFGGAGVSTESGIPDFRSVDGLYQQKYPYPPETMLSHSFLMGHPEEFYAFYREKMLALDAKPNPAHVALAQLEKAGKLKAVITQNIDGLHQQAGSREVLELHGSVHRNYCSACRKAYPVSFIAESTGVPRCELCGGMVRPDVVLYEEGLDMDVMNRAVSYLRQADVLIIGGTSLVVYPAAGLVQYYRGTKLVLINKASTSLDGRANLVISEPIGQVLGSLVDHP
jgi:NAD-dependent deacetylase